ncbi:hypothetical protein [Tenacibaculum piscium]|uniref:hypothetical protein n=1 Tax=Tenacibaculum piscium TaxID=1458515 RepID=UPI001F2C03D5|nr:hypothetical protein [Tenacibaculum piscium]
MKNYIEISNIDLNTKWINYNQTRLKGDKKTSNKILNDFIIGLLKENEQTIESFVYGICKSTLDTEKILSNNGTDVSESEIRIQHNLFKKILLPILVKKYKENDALYIRWIGQLEQFFFSDSNTTKSFLIDINDRLREAVMFDKKTNEYKTIESRYFHTQSFFVKSYTIKPEQKTLDLILISLAQKINFATHELPFAILRDADVFLKEIEYFESYYEQLDSKEKWRKALDEWKFIGLHWKIFSENTNKYQDFVNYLIKNNIENYA